MLKQPASTKIQKRGPGCRKLRGAVAAGAVVVTVRVVEIGLIPGMRTAGEKLQLDAAGNPVQEKLTAEEKSPTGLMVMLNAAAWPALRVALWGEATMAKSPGTERRTSSTSVADVAWGKVASPP
jgi:hypothetical protein